jgi:hypothetical protein
MATNSRAPSRVGQQSSSSGTTSSDTTTTAPAQLVSTQRTAQFKVASPDLYYGDRKKLRQFLQQVKLNFLFHPESVNTEEKKVVYASTYLRGAAFDWFEPYLKEFLGTPEEHRTPRTQEIFQRFSSFQLAIEQVYGDVDTVKEAERDLQNLRQQGSATDYASKFHQLSSRVNWDQAAFAAVFYKGLKDTVKDELARLDRPDDLMPLVELAIRIDNRLWERRLEKGKGGDTISYSRYQANARKKQTRTPGYYPPGRDMPMDLDATKRRFRNKQQGKGKRISQAEKEERFKKNLCLYCGKPGHRAKDCKASKQQLSATGGTPTEPSTPQMPQRKNWPRRSEMGTKGNPRKEQTTGTLRRTTPETTPEKRSQTPHELLSWTACYNDSCIIHQGDKQGSGWYPSKPRNSHQSLDALLTFNDDEPEYVIYNNDDEPGPEAMEPYAEILEIKKPEFVRLLTNLWTRVDCTDPDCQQDAQHEHDAYDPEAIPKEHAKTFKVMFCQKTDCPDKEKSEFHAHQGSDQRDASQAIVMNELESGWETIEVDDDQKEIGTDEDVEKFNLEEAEPAKGKKPFTTISEYRTWREPYGHFPCSNMSCHYHNEYEGHDHFRNCTQEDREILGVYLVSNANEARTNCIDEIGCRIRGMHTHKAPKETKNF